ncbi:MAG: hypothetical protein N2653_11740, partial [Burkholderiales bacterium]|nr:hypothetical protein [Burkholderiales bacterium]
MSCSSSETLGRPAAALVASAALHLSVVLGLEALPWSARNPAAARPDVGVGPLRASLRAEPEAPR